MIAKNQLSGLSAPRAPVDFLMYAGIWRSPHPHLQIRHRGPDVALGSFRDLAGDCDGSAPPPGEECRENLVFRGAGAGPIGIWFEIVRSGWLKHADTSIMSSIRRDDAKPQSSSRVTPHGQSVTGVRRLVVK